jgi:hypothetical protein
LITFVSIGPTKIHQITGGIKITYLISAVIIDKKNRPDKNSNNTAIYEATESFFGKLIVLPKYANLSKLTLPI